MAESNRASIQKLRQSDDAVSRAFHMQELYKRSYEVTLEELVLILVGQKRNLIRDLAELRNEILELKGRYDVEAE